ncbi:hypothetical protein INS49_004536 [Diaporthe citri]|uniref:uncharacterized protein n=1 Tax=Diaporthe citri TaxID=83186 RepID=UPI001C8023F9|nr:uncharacterized protein INS49_004536 [Diaporthe citri]KAG6354519.1 hypothetical protein INS49_004536 [Diaporthe citri]
MPQVPSAIDWKKLKPKILCLLSEGSTQKEVIEELSRDGSSITKSQLEYRLKCWGQRTRLSEKAWRYMNHKVQKRARNKKDSAVFFNGTLIPHSKVVKETRRHDRPSLSYKYSAPDFVLTSVGFKNRVLLLTSVKPPTPSQLPVTLVNQIRVRKPPLGVEQLEEPYLMSEWPEREQNVKRDAASHENSPCDPQIVTDLGLLIFHISNKLSTGNSHDDKTRLFRLGDTLKTLAMSSSRWKGLLIAGQGVTSKSLIEQLFEFSITSGDMTLAEMMLQIGADPNQRIHDRNPDQRVHDRDGGICVSALDFAIEHRYNDLGNLLLDSGAVYGQTSLKRAVLSGDFHTADRLLKSDPSLDLNFNYVNDPELSMKSRFWTLKLETVNLLGLVCLYYMGFCSYCNRYEATLSASQNHKIGCPLAVNECITRLEYLLKQRAAINLDTMILASFSVDVTTLEFLSQHGGDVRGFNRFGLSCLAAASMRMQLQYDVFDLLLRLGATIDIPQTHHAFGSQDSPIHSLCSREIAHCGRETFLLQRILNLLVKSGGNINYRIRHICSPSQLNKEREDFLWFQPSQDTRTRDCIAQARVESPLEYAIIARKEDIALDLVSWGCQLTGREILLAVKFRLLSLLGTLLNHGSWEPDGQSIRRIMRLALRWGHDAIVQFLLGEGVKFGEQDLIDALQYPGISALPIKTQVDLILATPNLDQRRLFGRPLLEICLLKFLGPAAREILIRFPVAYDSGALSATVLRALQNDVYPRDGFFIEDIQTMISRRTISNCQWEKENTALLIAATFGNPEVLRILLTPDTVGTMKTARLPQKVFSWILDQRYGANPFAQMDPTQLLNWQIIVRIDRQDRPPWCPTALQVAVSDENDAMVHFFLDAGVSVNEIPASEPIGNCMPRTALQAAVENGNLGLTTLLIERGACINAPAAEDSGATALQLACIHGYLAISLRLLELGADVNARGARKNGRTALEGAAEHGRIDTVQLLLNHGACTDGLHRAQYIKAVVHAEQNQHFAAAGLLKEHREWTAEDEECYKSLQSYEWCDAKRE